jgi:calcium permeable stress-gated cation channel
VTAFSAIGLYFFYFAYRYNIMYVYSTGVDTKGLLYPRALQQLFVGLYIAELCLIGLVAVSFGKNKDAAIGPLILLILLLVTTALYNVALNAALEPLLKFLPKSVAAEEARAAAAEAGAVAVDPAAEDGPDAKPALEEGEPTNGAAAATAKLEAPPSMMTKFLKPHVYADYARMRHLMPAAVSDDRGEATGEATGASETSSIARDAYLGPSVWAELTRLVVPRDTAGVSGSEVRASGKVVPITDGGATLGEKNEIVVDEEAMGELWWKEKAQRMREGA